MYEINSIGTNNNPKRTPVPDGKNNEKISIPWWRTQIILIPMWRIFKLIV